MAPPQQASLRNKDINKERNKERRQTHTTKINKLESYKGEEQ